MGNLSSHSCTCAGPPPRLIPKHKGAQALPPLPHSPHTAQLAATEAQQVSEHKERQAHWQSDEYASRLTSGRITAVGNQPGYGSLIMMLLTADLGPSFCTRWAEASKHIMSTYVRNTCFAPLHLLKSLA